MSTQILAKLFSSGTLIKVMRLFFFNPETPFDVDDIMTRTKSKRADVNYETKMLVDVGFLKRKVFYKDPVAKRTGSKARPKKKKVRGFVLDASFEYLPQLRALLVNEHILDTREMKKRLKRAGTVKLALATGVFVQDLDARLDLLVVADKARPSALHAVVKDLEALIGSELRYTLLSSEDFRFRLSVRDRLLRDVLEGNYTVIINTYKNLPLPKAGSV